MPDAVQAEKAEELGRVLEVLKDQEFRYADLSHDAGRGCVELLVRRKAEPRKGWWLLEVRNVKEWIAGRREPHGSDRVQFLFYDPGTRRLTLRCGHDEIQVRVDRLEVRASLLDGEPARKRLGVSEMPGWFQEEVREEKEARAEVQVQRSKTRAWILWPAVAAGTAFTFFLGLFTDAGVLPMLVAAPVFGGGAVLLLQRKRASPQVAGPIYTASSLAGYMLAGLPAACAKQSDSLHAGVSALVFHSLPNLLTFTLSTLFLASGGMLLFMWIRGREEMSL